MARHGADDEVLALERNVIETLDRAEIDHIADAGEPKLERGQERLPAGEGPRILLGEQRCRLPGIGGAVISERVHRLLRHSAARRCAGCACWMACQTAREVAGIGTSSEPTASVIAFISATGAAMAPASPQPFMPSGFEGHLVVV